MPLPMIARAFGIAAHEAWKHREDAMRQGTDLTVRGISDQFQSTDRYSLKGLAQALDRIEQECK